MSLLCSPASLARRPFRTFQRITIKRRQPPLRLVRPRVAVSREPTGAVSVAAPLGPALHREFEAMVQAHGICDLRGCGSDLYLGRVGAAGCCPEKPVLGGNAGDLRAPDLSGISGS